MLGAFRDNARTRSEFLELIRRPHLSPSPIDAIAGLSCESE
jgi:hypothetical protein